MVVLAVKDQQGHEVCFTLKRDCPLKKPMAAYCEQMGLQAPGVRFTTYDEHIAPDDAAELLGLEDNDVLDVATT